MRATDRDTGSNAEVSYAFSAHSLGGGGGGGSSPDSSTTSSIGDSSSSSSSKDFMGVGNLFAIDSKTGWIKTLESLDRENQSTFFLKVVASDKGSPERLTDTTMVQIRVTDVNDSPPLFTKDVYKGLFGVLNWIYRGIVGEKAGSNMKGTGQLGVKVV